MNGMPTKDGLSSAVVAIRALFSAAASSCALTTGDGERLRFVAADGAGAAQIVGVEMQVGRGIAGFVAMSGQAMAVTDVQRDPRFARDVAESTGYLPSTIVAVPVLSSDGEVVGVLSVLDPTVDASSGWALSVLGTLGTTLGRLVEAPAAATPDPASDLGALLARLSARGQAGERLAADVLGAIASYLDETDR